MTEYERLVADAMSACVITGWIRAARISGKEAEKMKPVIRKDGETAEQLYKRFKRQVGREGIIDAFKSHKIFKSKAERRHEKHKRAAYRAKLEGRH